MGTQSPEASHLDTLGGAAVGFCLATLVLLILLATWATATASRTWQWPACAILVVIGLPVALGLLMVALERWTDWWNEFFGAILLLVVLTALGVLALEHMMRRDAESPGVHITPPPRVHIEHAR